MSYRVIYRSFQSSLVVLLAAFSVVANAALFEDADARRAILDLRQKLEATQQSNKSQSEEISVLRKALLELQNQIDALKAEQSSLRGANEQVLRALSDVQLKQKDILKELDSLLGKVDSRLSKLEPIKVVLDGLEFQADPAEKRDFEAALAVFRTADFAAAQNSLLNFLRRYPTSGYASSSLVGQCAIRHQRLQRVDCEFSQAAQHCTSACARARSHVGHFQLPGRTQRPEGCPQSHGRFDQDTSWH